MKITAEQKAIITMKVQEIAPEAVVKIDGRKLSTALGRIKVNMFLRRVSEYKVYNGLEQGTYYEYDDDGKLTGNRKAYEYLPLKTAFHEYGHIVQVKTGIMDNNHYDINEITTEYLALKMMRKYFNELLSIDTENASRQYIRNYYDLWARMNRIVEMPEAKLERIFTEAVEIMEPYLEELAKAVAEAK